MIAGYFSNRRSFSSAAQRRVSQIVSSVWFLMKFTDWVDNYIFSNQWVVDKVDLNSIFFARTPGTLILPYKTSVLNGNCASEKWNKLKCSQMDEFL